MPTIIVELFENGEVMIQGKGFEGPECEVYTEELERELGVVEKRKRTPEFYAQNKSVQREVSRG